MDGYDDAWRAANNKNVAPPSGGTAVSKKLTQVTPPGGGTKGKSMAAEARLISPEETQNMLREKASKDGDEFIVKVLRRAHAAGVPELVASLSGATTQHFTSPELWVPPLCGGGNFMLQAYHPTDLSKQVGGFIQFAIKSVEIRDVDTSILKKSEWRGPPVLDFPQMQQPARQNDLGLYDVRSPPAPGSGDSATRSTQAWARSAGGGSVRHEEYDKETWANHQRSQSMLESERRALEEQKLVNARERHRDELEAMKKSHEADMRASEAKIMSQIAANRPSGPDASVLMFQEMMKQAAEDRRAAAQQAAEDRRAAAELAARADARFMTMMEKMNERKQENPLDTIKLVAEIFGKNNKDNGSGEAQMKMMHAMADTMSTVSGVAMDFVQTAAEMQLGQQGGGESPVTKGIESLVKGISAMAKGARRPAAPPPQFQQQALPPTYEQQARAQPPAPAPQPAPPQQPRPPQQKTDMSVIDQIDGAIRAKFDVAQVAAAIIAHIEDPSIQAALEDAGGDVEVLIQKRFGAWSNEAPSNAEYLKTFFKEIEAQIAKAGLGGGEAEENSEDDDGEDEE